MSALWTSDEIAGATGGAACGTFEASGVAFDSREIGAGDLFVALKGERFDAHDFLADAVGKGAAALVVSRAPAVGISGTIGAR